MGTNKGGHLFSHLECITLSALPASRWDFQHAKSQVLSHKTYQGRPLLNKYGGGLLHPA